jgi:hypothetical protein
LRSLLGCMSRLSLSGRSSPTRLLLKPDLRDRVQAVIYAYESGVIQPGA